MRGDTSTADGVVDSTEARTLLSRDYTQPLPAAEQKEPIARGLAREITEHKRQIDSQSYLERGISYIADPFTGQSESLRKMQALEEQASSLKGEPDKAMEQEMRSAIASDQRVLATDGEVTRYGSGMVQTAGLFIGGKKGLAFSAVSFAAGSAKPSDAGSTQAIDMTLGATKGLVTRGIFGVIGKSTVDIPTRALMMGSSARFSDALLTRQTYLNPTDSSLDLLGGAGRVVTSTLRPEAVATDLLVFGGGQLAMSNSMVKNFAQRSHLSATMSSSAAFGFASGSAEETTRQLSAGEFDITKIVGRGIARSSTDAIASIPGGLMGNRAAAAQRARIFDASPRPEASLSPSAASELARSAKAVDNKAVKSGDGDAIVSSTRAGVRVEEATSRKTTEQSDFSPKTNPADRPATARSWKIGGIVGPRYLDVIHPSIPKTTSREFQIVGGDEAGLSRLSGSRSASAVVAVRELTPKGDPVGETKQLLVQHSDSRTPINSRLAATCDLIAACNPQALRGELKTKHIFPETNGSVYLTRLANRLSFNTERPLGATTAGTIELGRMSVSDLLVLPSTADMLRTPRPLEKYAREMRHFKDPALRVIDGGADSIVFELADGRILKMTDRPYRKDGQPLWQPDWGHRTIQTPDGTYRFDARMLTKPTQIEVDREPIMYYIQERAQTPVSTKSLLKFHDKIDRDGTYVFWDGGVSSLGQAQLGYVNGPNGGRKLVLLDYDAVRKPHEVPAQTQSSGSGGDHWMSRYRGDRVDWEKNFPD
ncbi:MAG: hypothetical protein SGJ27_04760 [Candidatus Melainabacteria bacterium]|nr:hypothetical protein [Candidatus Melainabacteria bacterium]